MTDINNAEKTFAQRAVKRFDGNTNPKIINSEIVVGCIENPAINIVKTIDKKHNEAPIKIGSKTINLMTPYNFKDIIILKNGEVIGTNSAVVERFGFGESDQKKFQYFKDNEKLYAKLENYSTNKIVRLARKEWRRKADVILKKLFLCDYDVNKIPENDMPDCDGELIELAGLKKKKIGGAQISQKHANFFINAGSASAADFLNLSELVKERVFQKFNLELEEEVKIIGV